VPYFTWEKKTAPAEAGAVFPSVQSLQQIVPMVSHEFDYAVQAHRIHNEAPRTFKKLRHTLALLAWGQTSMCFPAYTHLRITRQCIRWGGRG